MSRLLIYQVLIALLMLACGTSPAAPAPAGMESGQVVHVVDGDTIDVVIDGQEHRVRYILINTPETKHPRRGVEPFGPEAAEANRALVAGQTVYLEKDVSDTDRYGRLLRYVYVGDTLVNEELLRLGLAQVSTFPPDVKYADRFLQVQSEAQQAGRGMWGDPLGHEGPYDPAGPDRDCSDFQTQAEAQAFFIAAGGPAQDPHNLDGDGNGLVCERLP